MPRIRVIRVERPARSPRAMKPLVLALTGLFLALVVVGAGRVTPAAASGTGAVTATINVGSQVLSLTVSPSAISFCTPGSPLTFPNGTCLASSPIAVTYGSTSGHIDVNGADAVPQDNGTHWTLCGGGGAACTKSTNTPGLDQYELGTSSTFILTNTPQCDTAFNATCLPVSPGQTVNETYLLEGPASSTSSASTFTTTMTWTALP